MSRPVRPKKALGQHFLTDTGVARRIADTVDVPGYESLPIAEVGPGTGMLTQFLAAKGRELKVVEIDSESVEWLHANMPDTEVVEGDFLRIDPTTLFGGRQFCLTGNYPYNISSQIFFRVLDCRDLIPVATGMLQREVARRICSGPGNKDYGILSVLLQMWYDCSYLFTVDEGVFDPPPKVKSGVLRLVRNSRTEAGCDWGRMRTVVKTAFGQRRKTLRNSLRPLLTPEAAASPLMALRPEQLGVEEFIHLTNLLTPPANG